MPQHRLRIGIFFGGRSREREISFAGGRTVYDNLDQALFEPIPIFVDGFGHFIVLHWQYLYRGTIRDFYPPRAWQPASGFSIYSEALGVLDTATQTQLSSCIGEQLTPEQFATRFDFAFLVLHGPYGEDGTLQGLLEWYQIPYAGTGLIASAIGSNKIFQKQLLQQTGFAIPPYTVLSKKKWQTTQDKAALFEQIRTTVGFPLVIKSPHQGSSIGVSILRQKALAPFITAVQRSLFIEEMTADTWCSWTRTTQQQWLNQLIDFRTGIGLPLQVHDETVYHPDRLLVWMDHYFQHHQQPLMLHSLLGETEVLIEAWIPGREFSCIVLEEEAGKPIALPPTEMCTDGLFFDYRAKYLSGVVRKQTPIQLPIEQVHAIRKACTDLFITLGCHVYARIDGFFTPTGSIYLNDPNTTSGMQPSSFLFHQAAKIGLNPTQLLTFLIRTSLAERIRTDKAPPQASAYLQRIDQYLHTTDTPACAKE